MIMSLSPIKRAHVYKYLIVSLNTVKVSKNWRRRLKPRSVRTKCQYRGNKNEKMIKMFTVQPNNVHTLQVWRWENFVFRHYSQSLMTLLACSNVTVAHA